MGLVLGWLFWTTGYAQLWQGPLSYKVKWGLLELAFSLVLLVAVWFWRSRTTGGRGWLARSFLGLLASTNLLYHFPVLFVIAGQLADAGRYGGPVITAGAFRELMVARETPALAVHFTLASLAVSGVLLLGYALRLARRGEPTEEVNAVAVWGGLWALAPSLAQLPVGLWVLLSLPREMQNRLMGTEETSTALFVLSIFAALWLMRELAGVAMGETERGPLVRSMIAMLVVVVLMTAMHQTARRVGAGKTAVRAVRYALPPAPAF